jgi:hypothetical protein
VAAFTCLAAKLEIPTSETNQADHDATTYRTAIQSAGEVLGDGDLEEGTGAPHLV